MDRYPDDRIAEDGTVEPDEADPTPPGVGPRTQDAGADGEPGRPRVPPSAGDTPELPE
jgi:hypothetical protein